MNTKSEAAIQRFDVYAKEGSFKGGMVTCERASPSGRYMRASDVLASLRESDDGGECPHEAWERMDCGPHSESRKCADCGESLGVHPIAAAPPAADGDARKALDSYATHGKPYPSDADLARAAAIVPQDQFAPLADSSVVALVGKWRGEAAEMKRLGHAIDGDELRVKADELEVALGSDAMDSHAGRLDRARRASAALEAGSVKQTRLPKRASYPKPDPDTGADTGPCCAHAYADGWNHCLDALTKESK